MEGVPGYVAELLDDVFAIAVDGGLEHFAKLRLKPEIWVGDGDSLKKPALLKKMKGQRIKLSRAKAYTDLEYALHVAGKAFLEGHWDGTVVVLGAQGGRLDHELGNMLAVQRFLEDLSEAVGQQGCPAVVSYGAHGMWLATLNEADFRQARGKLFSVLTLDPTLKLTIAGAKYNVRNKRFDHGSTGLSNEGIGRVVKIKLAQGARSPAFVLFPH